MYQVSNSFLQAMDDISRTLAVEVEISGVRYSTDAIIRFELERGVFDNDTFTIGQTMSNALTLEIFTTPTIQTGDELKLFTSLRVGEKDERVPLGVYYVDSTAINKEKMTLTCYDKMVTLIDEYIPSANHTTLAALFEDVLSQIGMTYDGVFHDVPIKAPLHGYTYRETLGFIASLNGGNMVVNRAGHLEIQRFQTVERSIPAKACFSFEVKEPYRVSKVFCQFGDVGITRGDSSGQCVAFENPYVTEQNIDTIYNLLNGLSFTAASLNYRGDLTLDPGDIFQFTDYKGDIYPLMCGRNKLTFNGGLSGQLDSIGESETTNSYAESQLKYKKNITKLTAELGKIQGVVQEIEQSHDGLEERVKKAELEITADAIKSKVENHFVAKDEINGLVTEEQLQSAITQSADSINVQVSSTYETKTEVANKINAIQVGGTNLLPNTKTLESGVSSTSYITSDTYLGLKVMRCNNTSGSHIDAYYFNSLINVEPNTEYTLSFYAKGDGAFSSFFYPNNVVLGKHSNGTTTTSVDGHITTTVTNSWKRYWITWKTLSNTSGLKNVIIGRITAGSDIYICGAKFEKGNKASEWSPCPDDIETTVFTIEQRVSTAESKITDQAITNLVKQNFYTKTETENAIVSKGYATQSQLQQTANNITSTVSQNYYTKQETENTINNKNFATKSEVQQTAENVQFRFSQSGGYNLIRNGNPKPWHEENWWVSANGWWYRDNPNNIGIQTYDTNEAYAGTSVFKVHPGVSYSFSCWLFAEGNTKGADVYFVGSSKDDGSHEDVQHLFNGGKDGWTHVKASFTTGSNTNYGFIRIDNNGALSASGYNVVFFNEVQLVKGSECYPQWSPNPNEVYDGITTIDKSGINVSASNINGYAKMTANGFFVNKDGKDLVSVDGYGLRLFDAKIQLTHANGNKYFLLDENGIVMYNPANGTHQWGKVAAINNKFTVASNGNSSGLSLGHHVNGNYVEDILCDSNGVVSVQRQINHNGVFYNNYGQMFVRQPGQSGWEITGRSDSQSIKPGGANQGGIGSNTQYINQSWIANRYNPSSLEIKHLSHYVDDLECLKLVSEVQPARYFYKEYDEAGNDITTFTTRTSQLGLIYEDVRECAGRDLITNEEDKAINLYNMVSTLWGAVRNLNQRLNELEIENLKLNNELDQIKATQKEAK